MQSRMAAKLKGLFELFEFTFSSVLIISLLVWKGLYIYQQFKIVYFETNKQTQVR